MIIFNGQPYNALFEIKENKLDSLLNSFYLEETIRIEQSNILFFEEHYFRLMASMRIFRIDIPMEFTMEYLKEKILDSIKLNKLSQTSCLASVKIYQKNRILANNLSGKKIDYLIECIKTTPISSPQFYELPVEIYKDHFISSNLLSTLEPANRLARDVGTVFALENKLDDCILINNERKIIDTLRGSLFILSGKEIKTPSLSSGSQNTVFRKKIIECIQKHPKFSINEQEISPFNIQKSDEVFIANINFGFRNIKQFKKKIFNSKDASSSIFEQLQFH